jgi:hypothetical protein
VSFVFKVKTKGQNPTLFNNFNKIKNHNVIKKLIATLR